MAEHIVIIGAGVIGASIGWHLARAGCRVTILDKGPIAGESSGRSFGWLNASFYADADHHRLRVASMRAMREMALSLGTNAIAWTGCLDFELPLAGLEQRATELRALGYPLDMLSPHDIHRRFPFLAQPPEAALFYPDEGAADVSLLTHDLLRAVVSAGGSIQTGCAVEAVLHDGSGATGVRTSAGDIAADRVVVAAGAGATALLASLDVELPLLTRPGVLFHTQAIEAVTDIVMVSPDMEMRQLPDGRFLAPTVAGHQGDSSDRLDQTPIHAARHAVGRLGKVLGRDDLRVSMATVGWRPVPGDGLPVMGPAGPDGLYVSVMHSGATLAAIAGQFAARELLGNTVPELAPYRIERFRTP